MLLRVLYCTVIEKFDFLVNHVLNLISDMMEGQTDFDFGMKLLQLCTCYHPACTIM
jgi:hypothetical protein